MFAGLKAMVAGALRDRAAAVGVMIAAALFLLTAWVLGMVALVLLLSAYLGTVGALFSVAAGLVVVTVASVILTRARNTSNAQSRAMTRALWAATAVNAASTLLRGNPAAPTEEGEAQAAPSAWTQRSAILIIGGLALILLAFLLPAVRGAGPDPSDVEPDPEA